MQLSKATTTFHAAFLESRQKEIHSHRSGEGPHTAACKLASPCQPRCPSTQLGCVNDSVLIFPHPKCILFKQAFPGTLGELQRFFFSQGLASKPLASALLQVHVGEKRKFLIHLPESAQGCCIRMHIVQKRGTLHMCFGNFDGDFAILEEASYCA